MPEGLCSFKSMSPFFPKLDWELAHDDDDDDDASYLTLLSICNAPSAISSNSCVLTHTTLLTVIPRMVSVILVSNSGL